MHRINSIEMLADPEVLNKPYVNDIWQYLEESEIPDPDMLLDEKDDNHLNFRFGESNSVSPPK